jgi:4'-phosphopantetheinyl transferase
MTPQVHVRWVPRPADGWSAGGASALATLLPLLTSEERMRAGSTSDPDVAARFVHGRVALRHLAAELASPGPGGEQPTAAGVTVWALCPDCGGPHGRPHVDVHKPNGRPLSVSIAHCAAGIAVAASWSGVVGIDVELADAPVDSMAAIAALVPPASRPAGRSWDPVQHWTRVEAVLKADGRGLRVDPAAVLVRREGGAISATIEGSPNPALAEAPGAPRKPAEREVFARTEPVYALADLRLDAAVRASVAILPRKPAAKPAVPVVTWRPLHLAATP